MKTCGIIGGMSWESTLTYYKIINSEINKRLGKLHSAKIVLYSVDFEEIATQQREGNWQGSAEILSAAAKSLEKAGADFVLIATNTMHKVANKVKKSVKIPLLDIRDALIEEIKKDKIKNVLLLGTKFTMEDDFYKNYLQKRGIDVEVPGNEERDLIHKIIFNELCLGTAKNASKEKFLEIIEKSGADGVILGCTEIGLLIKKDDTDKKIYDTTEIHAKKAASML